MRLKYEPDPFERRIEAKLRGIDGADGDTTPTVQWTMNVKKEIAGLCGDDCTAYFSGNPGGERLYDLNRVLDEPIPRTGWCRPVPTPPDADSP